MQYSGGSFRFQHVNRGNIWAGTNAGRQTVFRECERSKFVTDSTNVIFKTWYARMLTSEEQLSIQFYDWVRYSLKLKMQLKKHMGTKLCHVCTGRYLHHP